MNIDTASLLTRTDARTDLSVPEALRPSMLEEIDALPKDNELGQDEFLRLMLTQIEHQDPLEPMANGEFIAQMAQFSTVSGIEGMQASLDTMANSFSQQQTLQAAELVGDDVLIEGDTLRAGHESSMRGRFELDHTATSVTMSVHAVNGELVAKRSLGSFEAGRHDFDWDGITSDGDVAPPGDYRVSLSADGGATQETLASTVGRRIASVEFGAGGAALLNTLDGDTLTLGDVREIRDAAGAS